MTKKQFKHDLQRGLGSCVLELKNTEDIEKFRPLVLWACSRDLAYDVQSEGSRGFYLYQLITQFPDYMLFLEVVEKRLFQCMCSHGWEFFQDCELLSFFASSGNSRSLAILEDCYEKLLQILLRKRKRTKYGTLPEQDNFESLCISLVSICHTDRKAIIKQYKTIVRDLGMLIKENALYSFSGWEWFQSVSETTLGKRTVRNLLYHSDADECTKIFVHSMEEELGTREEKREGNDRQITETADEIYAILRNVGTVGQDLPLYLAHRMMRQNRRQEVRKLAEYYKKETEPNIRFRLLKLLANRPCAEMLDIVQLLADSESEDTDFASKALCALTYRRDARVREYAFELLKKGIHKAEAVSMLAANYESADKDFFVRAVKEIPVKNRDGEWHGIFSDVMDLFESPAKCKPRELLPYMYQNTFCSYCREHVVKEMGRRRMLTRELLEEMQYDCNEDIRAYARGKLEELFHPLS